MFLTMCLAIIAFLVLYRLFRQFGNGGFNFSPNFNEVPKHDMVNVSSNKAAMPEKFQAILNNIPDFDFKNFISNTEQLFDNIFEAFANSKHDFLTENLSKNMYESFSEQILKREAMNLRQEIKIEHKLTKIENAEIIGDLLKITVIFEVNQMSALINSNGSSIDNPSKISIDAKHKWLLSRKVNEFENKWLVEKTSII